ncbi:conserved hypothetical protein [Ricinus communis]|uniref:Uncharacterized protein n=1 Tax=Ricinus communis TaxID=3988 RepID=B9TAR4_RICCO|nr:conserved hypothetical protein [Ricinus communis]
MALQDDESPISVPPNRRIDDVINIACLFDDCPIQSTSVLGDAPHSNFTAPWGSAPLLYSRVAPLLRNFDST